MGILSLLCVFWVCLFVCLYGHGFLSSEKDSGMKLCMFVQLLSGMSFSHFGELWPRGGFPRIVSTRRHTWSLKQVRQPARLKWGSHMVGFASCWRTCSCVVCFCCVRFSFFSATPSDWLGRTSLWFRWCRMLRRIMIACKHTYYCCNECKTDYCRHTGVVPKKCTEKRKLTGGGNFIYGGQEFSLSWFVVLVFVRTYTKFTFSAFCDGMHQYRCTSIFFVLQANFVKINLRHAASVLVLYMHIGTFLFPKQHCLYDSLSESWVLSVTSATNTGNVCCRMLATRPSLLNKSVVHLSWFTLQVISAAVKLIDP